MRIYYGTGLDPVLGKLGRTPARFWSTCEGSSAKVRLNFAQLCEVNTERKAPGREKSRVQGCCQCARGCVQTELIGL